MQLFLSFPAILYALLALPLLALLMLLVPRARRVVVGSLQFWQDAPADAALEQIRHRRRLSLASVLLLATLAAVILALSGPEIMRPEPTGPAGVVIVDRSASLLMTDGGSETRLSRLRSSLERFLDRLPPDLPLTVQLLPDAAGTNEGTAAELREMIPSALRPPDAALHVQELRRQAIIEHNRRGAPVILFTDVSPYGSDDARPPFVYLLATGARAENVALTGASVTMRDGRRHVLVQTFASPEFAGPCRMTVRGQGVSASALISLSPGDGAHTLPLAPALPERITVGLDVRDALARDNRLDLVRVSARRYRVGIVGRADPALMRFLHVSQAEVIEFDDAAAAAPETVDVTLFAGCVASPSFRGPAILVNPPESTGPLTRTGRHGGPGLWAVADAESPLVAHLPRAPVEIARWPVFEVSPGADVVIRSDSGDPLVVHDMRSPGGRVAVLWSTEWSNVSWNASVVIFWANCLRSLSPSGPTVERYEPRDLGDVALGDVEGRQVRGPAVDDTASAAAAMAAHRREVRPAAFRLWPLCAILALLLMVARVWVMR